MLLSNNIVDQHQFDKVASSIHQFVTCGEPLEWYSEHEALVEYGVARFVDKDQKVKIEEPLALVGILRFFDHVSHTMGGHIASHFQVNQGL